VRTTKTATAEPLNGNSLLLPAAASAEAVAGETDDGEVCAVADPIMEDGAEVVARVMFWQSLLNALLVRSISDCGQRFVLTHC